MNEPDTGTAGQPDSTDPAEGEQVGTEGNVSEPDNQTPESDVPTETEPVADPSLADDTAAATLAEQDDSNPS